MRIFSGLLGNKHIITQALKKIQMKQDSIFYMKQVKQQQLNSTPKRSEQVNSSQERMIQQQDEGCDNFEQFIDNMQKSSHSLKKESQSLSQPESPAQSPLRISNNFENNLQKEVKDLLKRQISYKYAGSDINDFASQNQKKLLQNLQSQESPRQNQKIDQQNQKEKTTKQPFTPIRATNEQLRGSFMDLINNQRQSIEKQSFILQSQGNGQSNQGQKDNSANEFQNKNDNMNNIQQMQQNIIKCKSQGSDSRKPSSSLHQNKTNDQLLSQSLQKMNSIKQNQNDTETLSSYNFQGRSSSIGDIFNNKRINSGIKNQREKQQIQQYSQMKKYDNKFSQQALSRQESIDESDNLNQINNLQLQQQNSADTTKQDSEEMKQNKMNDSKSLQSKSRKEEIKNICPHIFQKVRLLSQQSTPNQLHQELKIRNRGSDIESDDNLHQKLLIQNTSTYKQINEKMQAQFQQNIAKQATQSEQSQQSRNQLNNILNLDQMSTHQSSQEAMSGKASLQQTSCSTFQKMALNTNTQSGFDTRKSNNSSLNDLIQTNQVFAHTLGFNYNQATNLIEKRKNYADQLRNQQIQKNKRPTSSTQSQPQNSFKSQNASPNSSVTNSPNTSAKNLRKINNSSTKLTFSSAMNNQPEQQGQNIQTPLNSRRRYQNNSYHQSKEQSAEINKRKIVSLHNNNNSQLKSQTQFSLNQINNISSQNQIERDQSLNQIEKSSSQNNLDNNLSQYRIENPSQYQIERASSSQGFQTPQQRRIQRPTSSGFKGKKISVSSKYSFISAFPNSGAQSIISQSQDLRRSTTNKIGQQNPQSNDFGNEDSSYQVNESMGVSTFKDGIIQIGTILNNSMQQSQFGQDKNFIQNQSNLQEDMKRLNSAGQQKKNQYTIHSMKSIGLELNKQAQNQKISKAIVFSRLQSSKQNKPGSVLLQHTTQSQIQKDLMKSKATNNKSVKGFLVSKLPQDQCQIINSIQNDQSSNQQNKQSLIFSQEQSISSLILSNLQKKNDNQQDTKSAIKTSANYQTNIEESVQKKLDTISANNDLNVQNNVIQQSQSEKIQQINENDENNKINDEINQQLEVNTSQEIKIDTAQSLNAETILKTKAETIKQSNFETNEQININNDQEVKNENNIETNNDINVIRRSSKKHNSFIKLQSCSQVFNSQNSNNDDSSSDDSDTEPLQYLMIKPNTIIQNDQLKNKQDGKQQISIQSSEMSVNKSDINQKQFQNNFNYVQTNNQQEQQEEYEEEESIDAKDENFLIKLIQDRENDSPENYLGFPIENNFGQFIQQSKKQNVKNIQNIYNNDKQYTLNNKKYDAQQNQKYYQDIHSEDLAYKSPNFGFQIAKPSNVSDDNYKLSNDSFGSNKQNQQVSQISDEENKLNGVQQQNAINDNSNENIRKKVYSFTDGGTRHKQNKRKSNQNLNQDMDFLELPEQITLGQISNSDPEFFSLQFNSNYQEYTAHPNNINTEKQAYFDDLNTSTFQKRKNSNTASNNVQHSSGKQGNYSETPKFTFQII